MDTPVTMAPKARVIVVDDEPAVREILRDFLAYEGYSVAVADTGAEGLQIVLSEPFDLVLTDLEMPKLNGLDFLREIKSLKNPPVVIMMTGYGTVETATEAMREGAYDYILKPFQIEDLAHLIQRALDHKRLAAENIRLQEMVSLYAVSERLNNARTLSEIGDVLVGAVREQFDADLVCVWEYTQSAWRRLRDAASGAAASAAARGLDTPQSMPLLKAFQSGDPLILTPREVSQYFPGFDPLPHSGVLVPLRTHGRINGMVGAFRVAQPIAFTEGNRKSIQLYADRAAMSLENARLYENLKRTFLQTIQSLVVALEAKDEYTKGHSERVMQWAMIIGEQLDLSDDEMVDLQRGALLHDIGKIGLNLEALNRPGKLTPEEIEQFKLHTTLGKKILEPIDFLKNSLPAVTHHHERWDGHGYPDGLAGEGIPFIARIMGVADSFEVMITDRVYRRALTLDQAKAELERCAGTQFDPRIAALLRRWLQDYRHADELPVKGGRRSSTSEPPERTNRTEN